MSRFFAAIGRFAVRFRWVVVVAWIAAAIGAQHFFPSLDSVAGASDASFLPASSPSMQAARLAPHGHGMEYVESALHDRGFDHLRQMLQTAVASHEGAQKKG